MLVLDGSLFLLFHFLHRSIIGNAYFLMVLFSLCVYHKCRQFRGCQTLFTLGHECLEIEKYQPGLSPTRFQVANVGDVSVKYYACLLIS